MAVGLFLIDLFLINCAKSIISLDIWSLPAIYEDFYSLSPKKLLLYGFHYLSAIHN